MKKFSLLMAATPLAFVAPVWAAAANTTQPDAVAASGANFRGTASSYARNTNPLELPGRTVVNTFVQFRPTHSLELMLNANLFNTLGVAEVTQAAIPASGMVLARSITARTISSSLRFSF